MAVEPNAVFGGRYRIEAILGQGGMGAVYRALDQRTGDRVALKQLRTDGHNHAAAALMVSQFEREYHTLCQLAHPSIIEVYDYGIDGATAFYTMQLLDGQDLRERGRLPWREACAIFRDVASSLAIMHSRRLLHRDISARNVRCTTAGIAKLIDFGAMAQMGLVKHVVGTAPFVPPEALQLQALDGRADLYALGVLAYWVLTGRYPYPAHTLADLPTLWSNPPANVRHYEPELPEALDLLVMELIELDRHARPVSAAEVMERLSGMAGLALRELPEVSRAYLVAPTLIGREAQLQAVRARLISAQQGQGGGSVLIEGAEGTGRSRLLDACVLEAKLLGATVLRADASDAQGAAYGVAKALCARLFEELPKVALQHALPWRSVLARLLPELSLGERPLEALPVSLPAGVNSLSPQPAPADAAATNAQAGAHTLQSALRDFVLSVAHDTQLVIAVDDSDAIDLRSAALLGALAHGAKRRRLTLLVSTRSTAAPSPALSLLREVAQLIALEPFSLEQSEQLLRSLFGDAERIPTLNERLFALAGGNPRWTMALCEHLVEHGLARYEAGSWQLPVELAPGDLPQSLADASLSKIAELPEDARALADTLCLCDPVQLSLDKYPLLTEHGDAGRCYRAIDALVAAGLLMPRGDRYRFSQHGVAAALRAKLDPARAPESHLRLARAHENCDDAWRVPYHLLLAGRELDGLMLLIGGMRSDPRVVTSKVAPDAFAMATAAAEQLGLSLSIQLSLQLGVVGLSVVHANHERFTQYAWPLLERVLRDIGLRDYQELGDGVPPEARLQQAQARTLERYHAATETTRGLTPQAAAASLQQLVWYFVGMAAIAQQLELVERLPSFEPLFPILPQLRVSQLRADFNRHMQSGRTHLAQRASFELVALARQPELAELNVGPASVLHWELHNQGLFAAARGDRAALDWVAEIESVPFYRANARRVRMAYELMHGNLEAASTLRRRAELFALEDGNATVLPGTSSRLELLVHSYTDDVIGVKRTMERFEVMAQRFPRWRPTWAIARSQYLRIQGDLAGALDALTSALQATAPGRHLDWGLAATMHVALLNVLGRSKEAVELGAEYIVQCEREQLLPSRLALLRVVSEGLTRVGRLDEALQMIDEHIALQHALGTRGVQLGLAYEARARIAIATHDDANLRHYATLCAQEYKGARNPTLSTKYRGLVREAEAVGLAVTTSMQHALGTTSGFGAGELSRQTQLATHTLNSRLLGCIDRAERAHEGLRLLLESSGAAGGFLFELGPSGLGLLASVEEDAPSPQLLQQLASRCSTSLDSEDPATSFELAQDEPAQAAFKDPSGRLYEPLLLTAPDNQPVLIAALRYASVDRHGLRRELLEAMAEALT